MGQVRVAMECVVCRLADQHAQPWRLWQDGQERSSDSHHFERWNGIGNRQPGLNH